MTRGSEKEDEAGPSTGEYELACNDCGFTEIVEGDVDVVYDAVEAHVGKFGSGPQAHSVNFERRV